MDIEHTPDAHERITDHEKLCAHRYQKIEEAHTAMLRTLESHGATLDGIADLVKTWTTLQAGGKIVHAGSKLIQWIGSIVLFLGIALVWWKDGWHALFNPPGH